MFPFSEPSKCLNIAIDSFRLVYSDYTLLELKEVLMRKKFDKYVSVDKREMFLASYLSYAEHIAILHKVDICRDIQDNKFLDLAINSQADYLLTGDKDLLVIEEIYKTKIINTKQFLQSIDTNL
jgi:uncharacterized protein